MIINSMFVASRCEKGIGKNLILEIISDFAGRKYSNFITIRDFGRKKLFCIFSNKCQRAIDRNETL